MQVETLPPGTILNGRYRIERALGSGGFGHVYLSVDLQTKTLYALKEYIVTGASGKAQLEHEAQVLSHLHHPNLPAYLAAFDERGHYYVVLGYIEGNDLTEYVRAVRQKNEVIPLALLMEWLLSICDAVAFLHSQRPPIIHRDIKPDNIRITPNGTAMLVDLGNAKTAADGARTLFFIRHQGTPGYAPLEQYPGGTGTDERSDIYALGGTLYFALTAHEPPSVSARSQALQQRRPDMISLQERLAENPPDVPQEAKQFRLGVSKPSKPVPRHSRHLAQLGALPPEVLRKLDSIIRRAMAMKPADRYQTVTEFSNDLRTILKALPASTTPVTNSPRPLDPHSTQPDLPMLYEAMQNAQAAKQNAPVPQPPSPAAASSQPVGQRCPRCGAELNRPAPSFCPACGNPLANAPGGSPNQGKAQPSYAGKDVSQAPTIKDIADEATLLISPRPSPKDSRGQSSRVEISSAQATQQGNFTATPPQVSAVGQPAPKAPGQATPSTQSRETIPQVPVAPDKQGTRTNVKPFLTSASLSPGNQAQAMARATQPALTQNRQDNRKTLLISLIITLIVLLLVMLILLVFLRGQPQSHQSLSGWTRDALVQRRGAFG
ncbi:MAG TPA: protein kinase [Ktedonobacteraceae bacterium]|nr:protein kinase [Ktedonobacteraceae bacterium]